MFHSLYPRFTRRHFLSGATALSAASILGWPEISRAEPPLEVNKIRQPHELRARNIGHVILNTTQDQP